MPSGNADLTLKPAGSSVLPVQIFPREALHEIHQPRNAHLVAIAVFVILLVFFCLLLSRLEVQRLYEPSVQLFGHLPPSFTQRLQLLTVCLLVAHLTATTTTAAATTTTTTTAATTTAAATTTTIIKRWPTPTIRPSTDRQPLRRLVPGTDQVWRQQIQLVKRQLHDLNCNTIRSDLEQQIMRVRV
jgi:hypothetical protein